MWCKRPLLRVFVITLALLALAGARAAGGVDLTPEFLNAYRSDCAFGAAQVDVLRRHKVLLVPGYLGNLQPTYFAEQLRWLAAIGVDREKVAIRSGHSVAVNAPIVAAAIRDSARPVVLITHSKGSVDALEALRAEPSLRKKVKGWVSLQGAFFGSPVADILLDGSMLDPAVAAAILGFFGGTMESARDLTTGASRGYYRDHAAAIGAVVREVPAIAFATALDGAPGARIKTLLDIPRELMWREGIRSDGLVPTEAAVLPGMNFVKLAGVDHIAPVMPALEPFDRVRMTKALLLALRTPFRGLPRDVGCRDPR
ncbi:MAG: hypothetical protein OEZ08_14520 [Betaproteobacteria bacterium]|nr:hypothetical protein [Betaproteobacteria bacterium]